MLTLELVKVWLPHFIYIIYCSYSLYSWKLLKNLPVSILSFMNNGFLVAQNKSLTVSNSLLFCSYQITLSFLERFRLMMEYGKIEVFHFFRSHGVFNPPLLDLSSIRGPILCPKNIWRYLDTFLTRNYSSNNTLTLMQIKLSL